MSQENKRGRPRKADVPLQQENKEAIEKQPEIHKLPEKQPEIQEPENKQPETPKKLFGERVTEKALLALGGGVFPFSVWADNITQSDIALPEINTSINAYAKNAKLMFLNERQLNTFVTNFHYFTALWGWNEEKGLILKGE